MTAYRVVCPDGRVPRPVWGSLPEQHHAEFIAEMLEEGCDRCGDDRYHPVEVRLDDGSWVELDAEADR